MRRTALHAALLAAALLWTPTPPAVAGARARISASSSAAGRGAGMPRYGRPGSALAIAATSSAVNGSTRTWVNFAASAEEMPGKRVWMIRSSVAASGNSI